jgi:hypothetical protein
MAQNTYGSSAGTRSATTRDDVRTRTPAQIASLVVGIAFLVVGAAGFIPGITEHVGDMTFAGHESDAKLLGVFEVSVLHNIVHLLFGIAGLVLARSIRGAKNYLIGGGIIYLVLFVYGIAVPMNSGANFVPVNTADNVLHVLLGIGMIALGALLTRRPDVAPATDVANS